MTEVLRAVLAMSVAAAVTRRAAGWFTRAQPHARANYRGLGVTPAGGIALLLGAAAGWAVLAVAGVADGSELAAWPQPFAMAAVAFALLGLWDDLTPGEGRGWRAHLEALRHGRFTGGAIKLAAGGALALVAAAPFSPSLAWALLNGALVALSANLFNLLDVRPGRALKWFALAGLFLLLVGAQARPVLAVALAAAVAFLPFDLRERAMLGDAGANAVGAVLGLWVVVFLGAPARLIVLIVLAALHGAADRPGLSALIRSVPPLRRFDEVGRVPE